MDELHKTLNSVQVQTSCCNNWRGLVTKSQLLLCHYTKDTNILKVFMCQLAILFRTAV